MADPLQEPVTLPSTKPVTGKLNAVQAGFAAPATEDLSPH